MGKVWGAIIFLILGWGGGYNGKGPFLSSIHFLFKQQMSEVHQKQV